MRKFFSGHLIPSFFPRGNVFPSLTDMLLGMRERSETHAPENIHTGVVLTDYMDGGLIRRAIVKALGPEVRIVGGKISDTTLASEGMAKLALKRVEACESFFFLFSLPSLHSEEFFNWRFDWRGLITYRAQMADLAIRGEVIQKVAR